MFAEEKALGQLPNLSREKKLRKVKHKQQAKICLHSKPNCSLIKLEKYIT